MIPAKTDRPRRAVARRLAVTVILFSSLITLISTAYQLYHDYNRDLSLIEIRLQQIQDVHLQSIAGALWVADEREMQILVDGIQRLPDMQYLEIRERDKVWASVGLYESENVIARKYTLTYTHMGQELEIGMLTAVATLKGVYQRLIDKTVVILVSNGIKTFFVAGFILLVFHFFVTRHLAHMAEFVRGYGPDHLGQSLTLERDTNPRGNGDELDQLVDAFNEMRETLCKNLTELEAHAERRRESESRLRDFVETATDWVWETDAEHRFSLVSGKAREAHSDVIGDAMLGRKPRELDWIELDPDDWRQLRTSMDTRQPFDSFEYPVRHQDLRRSRFQSSGKPVFDGDGEFLGFRGTGRDVTVQRDIERQLRQAQKIEAVGLLTSGISHDFNNLLTIIIGNLKTLQEMVGDQWDEEKSGILEDALSAATDGADLTKRLLAFSRGAPGSLTPTAVNGVIDEIGALIHYTLPDNVSLTVDGCDADPMVLVDASDFASALLNLAINARDAMADDGGTLTLGARIVGAEQMEPVPGAIGPHVAVTVVDTGRGMSKIELEHACEPFFTTKPLGAGTGLGLSGAYAFAQRSGDQLRIESARGKGTRVTLLLAQTSTASRAAS